MGPYGYESQRMEEALDDETIVMDITGRDLERQAREVARPAPHRTLRPALNGYRREDVDQALAAADKRNADLERDNAALSGVCENTRALVEDLQRRLGAAEERRRAVERERDGYRGQIHGARSARRARTSSRRPAPRRTASAPTRPGRPTP